MFLAVPQQDAATTAAADQIAADTAAALALRNQQLHEQQRAQHQQQQQQLLEQHQQEEAARLLAVQQQTSGAEQLQQQQLAHQQQQQQQQLQLQQATHHSGTDIPSSFPLGQHTQLGDGGASQAPPTDRVVLDPAGDEFDDCADADMEDEDKPSARGALRAAEELQNKSKVARIDDTGGTVPPAGGSSG